MDEEAVINEVVDHLASIAQSLYRIAEAMEQANDRPKLNIDEYGDKIE